MVWLKDTEKRESNFFLLANYRSIILRNAGPAESMNRFK